MDKSWIKLVITADGRTSQPYFDGVNSFIDYAMAICDQQGNLLCPCHKCVNYRWENPQDVQLHLLKYGIMQSYTIWQLHGEPCVPESTHPYEANVDSNEVHLGGIDLLVEDRMRAESADATERDKVHNFDKLLNDAHQEIYPGCKDYSVLKFLIEFFNEKVMNRWSNHSVDKILKFQSKLLPPSSLVPKSTREAKKILSDLGMSYELIDVCRNDCALFWKENEKLDKCPKCDQSRYKNNHGRGKKIAYKVLRYLPVTPRLKRLYMIKKIANDMTWHKEKAMDDTEWRHPAHSDEWKDFDLEHPEFALELRNVRLGLTTDGFNPLKNMNNSYNMWPVILIPYNLPPWLAVKEPFFMLSLLFPGRKQPDIDIDVYLRPLVDELEELEKNGALTYYASSGETFRMHAALFWTLHDWPAFGDVSGWRTKGHYACYSCNDEPFFESLRSKTTYMNHRGYLPENHPERRKRGTYNGKIEKRKRSLELPLEKIQNQLDRVLAVSLGKDPSIKKRPRFAPNWTKISILYKLPSMKK